MNANVIPCANPAGPCARVEMVCRARRPGTEAADDRNRTLLTGSTPGRHPAFDPTYRVAAMRNA